MKAILPQVVTPFQPHDFNDIAQHVTQIRRAFDWPGIPLHDAEAADRDKLNCWHWRNLPLLVSHHNSPALISLVSDLAGQPLKPSYVFLSMFASDGSCSLHTDPPRREFTLEMVVSQDARWPLYVAAKPYLLSKGEALFYSGTQHPHYRMPMDKSYDEEMVTGLVQPTYCNLAFFYFVPATFIARGE